MRNRIENIFVLCARMFMNAIYFACGVFPRIDEVVLVSRQTNNPSYDFMTLGQAFEKRGYRIVFLTRKLSRKTVPQYVVHALREIYHLARCRVCFVDRYDPIVSLMDFDCEQAGQKGEALQQSYTSFPAEPIIVQIWHAFGAFKKFGFQSRDTIEGHVFEKMQKYRIHQNYSWVLCSGERCRPAFSEAFNCPIERVIPLLRPEYDELKRLRESLDSQTTNGEFAGGIQNILFAPTLRKSSESRHPFRELFQTGEWRKLERSAPVVWAFHPLERSGIASGAVNDALLSASIVITDYSSIVYEAFLLKRPVVFYVSDIDEYRVSPGLNEDPLVCCPEICFTEASSMLLFVEAVLHGDRSYPWEALEKFAGGAIDEIDDNAIDRLIEQVMYWINRGEQ